MGSEDTVEAGAVFESLAVQDRRASGESSRLEYRASGSLSEPLEVICQHFYG